MLADNSLWADRDDSPEEIIGKDNRPNKCFSCGATLNIKPVRFGNGLCHPEVDNALEITSPCGCPAPSQCPFCYETIEFNQKTWKGNPAAMHICPKNPRQSQKF